MSIWAAVIDLKTLYCKGEFEIINERVEVQQYLQGKNLHRDIEYRICLLLAKWYYEQGYRTEPEIRAQLKSWAQNNNFYFEVPMKVIASRVIDDKMQLTGDTVVSVSASDIDIILDRFDTYYERVVALGVLCYAKVYADNKGEFKISQSALCHWLQLDKKTARKYMAMLETYGYVKKVGKVETKSWYDTMVVSNVGKYRILVPYKNLGEFEMSDNNIDDLYCKAILGYSLAEEIWYPVDGYNGWYQVSNQYRVKVCERIVGGRIFAERLIKPFKSKSGKLYVNLFGEDGKQKKVMVEKLLKQAS